jgi:hypothetical protein
VDFTARESGRVIPLGRGSLACVRATYMYFAYWDSLARSLLTRTFHKLRQELLELYLLEF